MLLNYFLPIFLGYILIAVFYSAFKSEWPNLYFSTSDFTSLYISVDPVRYLAFRFAPVTLITAFVLGAAAKNLPGREIAHLGLGIGALHGLLVNGRSLVQILVKSKNIKTYFNKRLQVIIHSFSLLTVVFAGFVGGKIARTSFMESITPSFSGLVDNVWASLITALFAVYLYKLYERQVTHPTERFDKSLKEISPDLISFIQRGCEKNRSNKTLVLSVCVIENIQRPKWFRNLEKLKSVFFKKGTYGIIQMESDKYLDDEGSVELAIRNYFANEVVSDECENGSTDVRRIAKKYNRDQRFIELVVDAYLYLKKSDQIWKRGGEERGTKT